MSFHTQQGWLFKKGGSSKTYRKRWFVLDGTVMKWYEPGWFTMNPVDGKLKGEVDVAGGSVGYCQREEGALPSSAISVVASSRTLQFHAGSQTELDTWLSAVRGAVAGGMGGSGSRGGAAPGSRGGGALQMSSAAPLPPSPNPTTPLGGTWRGGVSGDSASVTVALALEGFLEGSNYGGSGGTAAAAAASTRLPVLVDIDGGAVVGAELRVRGAFLDSLCIQWFTLGGGNGSGSGSGSVGSPHALPMTLDATALPGYAPIPGATALTYVVDGSLTGQRVGCCVRRAGGSGGRWSVLASLVAPRDPLKNTLRLFPRLHNHKKYCDRRVRVCTALGRYREGEVLACAAGGPFCEGGGESGGGGNLSPKGYTPLLEGWSYTWWRSAPLMSEAQQQQQQQQGSSASSSSSSSSGSASRLVTDLEYHRVFPRLTTDLPPNPSDSQPAPTLVEVRKAMDARRAAPPTPKGGALESPMFAEDVACMYVCAAVRDPGGGGGGASPLPASIIPSALPTGSGHQWILSQCVGPIEAAPPRAREIWIEGEPKVGSLLLGNVYYYGGVEGESVVSWVAIGDDGEAREVKPPVPCKPPFNYPLPCAGEAAGGPGDAHPRALRITPALLGCLIKFRVQPVRADGDEGHMESSRPSKEVFQ